MRYLGFGWEVEFCPGRQKFSKPIFSTQPVGQQTYLVVMIVQYHKDQYSTQEEIKSRLKSVNACYHSVQNVLFSSLVSQNLKIKIYRNIILSQ